ncbi:MAG: molybdopterin-dependent oxidoreductase [Beijerinckiaceae bacterium]
MNAIVETAPTIRTTCPYCGVGCGVLASPRSDGGLAVAGDPDHPANFGRLCVKGAALGETVGLDGRLLQPMMHGQPSTWNRALDHVARGFMRTLNEHGPDSVAFYLSGQLLTEDYYVANKLMKGFMGSANVDTNSRLCMASSVAGHRRVMGSDTVPNSYADLDAADLIVLVGSNAAWCHPVLFQRMQAAREKRGAKVINIDPRRTATSEGADLHLAIAPGMDTVLFAWLFQEIGRRGVLDPGYIARHTNGFEDALSSARAVAPDAATVARLCGIKPDEVEAFVDLWTRTGRVVTCYSQGVNQSAQGTDKVAMILNCHLAAGRIGKEGCGPFSLTGQPNAMGGREVGGLSNMLAAHMGFAPGDIDRVRRFWGAPRMAEKEGLKAVALFDAIERGEIKALWVMCTNPAVSLPKADRVREALGKLDLFVVSEALASTDTVAAGAHVVLPATTWAEKDGTVTNSERRISRQRALMPPPGEARHDWWIVCEVAKRMGFDEQFAFTSPAAIFREHAALSAFENGGSRDFDIGGLAHLSDREFEALAPVQWPLRKGEAAQERFFADGGFYTPDGRARLLPVASPELKGRPNSNDPLMLNTGRVRDQWHTMTRTGKAPRLARHIAEPFVEMHPEDAEAFGLREGGHAIVRSALGEATLKVRISPGQRRGMVFAPIHWNDATASRARIGALVQDHVDPYSGQPEMKATPVSVWPIAMRSAGFILSRAPLALPKWLAYARVALPDGEGVLFASPRAPAELNGLLQNFLPGLADAAYYDDAAAGDHRTIVFGRKGRMLAALFVAAERDDAAFDWMAERFAEPAIDRGMRQRLLAGRPPAGADLGPVVCSCFGVRRNAISQAAADGADTVEAIGERLKAGTNCGSCRPEIKGLIGLRELA